MDYIQTLRQHLGQAPIQMVGATVFALDEQDCLLMLMRTDNKMWGVPGGAIELGEKVEEAARRETREETGLEIGEMSLFGVFSGDELYYKYPNGDETHNISVVYLTRDLRGKIDINLKEHSSHQYFPLNALPQNISPPLMPAIRYLVERYG